MPTELAKLEDVQGLRFQHSLVLPSTSFQETKTRSLVVSKYNILVQYGGTSALFYDLQKVMDAQGVCGDNLLMTLEVNSSILSVVSGVYHSESCSRGTEDASTKSKMEVGIGSNQEVNTNNLDLEDLLLIETVSSVSVYSLANNSYLYTYNDRRSLEASANEGLDMTGGMWYRMTSRGEALLLLIVDEVGRMSLIDIRTGSLVSEIDLTPKELGDGIAVPQSTQDKVRILGNVDSKRMVYVTSSNRVYLVDLGSDADESRPFNLSINPNSRDSEDLISKTISGEYEVVGCHLVKDMVLLALIVPEYEDNLVLMCDIVGGSGVSGGDKELVVRAYCYNELFLMTGESDGDVGKDLRIRFKYIDKWDLFIVYSNKSTSTLLITGNRSLIELNGGGKEVLDAASKDESVQSVPVDGRGRAGVGRAEYHVLLMSEGYCLESNDFDAFILDVFVYTNYKNDIYRKFSLEDTPTLKDPVIVGLLVDSGDVSLFYVDRHVISTDNREVEVMCGLYSKDKDAAIASCGSQRDRVSDYASGERREELSDGKENSGLIDVIKSLSFNTGDGNTSLSDGSGAVGVGNNRVGRCGMPGNIEDTSLKTQKLLEKYYREGYEYYRSDKKLFKLHEALSNSLDYFNTSLGAAFDSDCEDGGIPVSNSISSGCNADCKLDKLKDYIVIIRKLLNIQKGLHDTLSSLNTSDVTKSNDGTTRVVKEADSSCSGDLNGNNSYKQLMDRVYDLIDNISVEGVERLKSDELVETENSLLYINSALKSLYKRFDGLESRLSEVHNELVYNEIVGAEGAVLRSNDLGERPSHASGSCNTSNAAAANIEQGEDGGACSVIERKLERLLDDVVGLYNQPLVNLSSDLGRMGIFSGPANASAEPLGGGSIGKRGGARLRYNNYELLFKGSGGTTKDAFGSSCQQADGSFMSNIKLSGSDFKKSDLITLSAVKDGAPSKEDMGRSSSDLISDTSGNMLNEPTKTASTNSLGIREGFIGADAVDKTTSVTPTQALPTTNDTTNTSNSVGDTVNTGLGDTVSGVGGGVVQFGMTTSLLKGYNLVPNSLTTVSGGDSSNAAAASSGIGAPSAFAEFNTNKSLLDIALNSSSRSANATVSSFSSSFPVTGGGGFFGSTNTLIGATSAGATGLSLNTGSISSGSFTGVGNFASNSFNLSTSLFSSDPSANSLLSQGGRSLPTNSSNMFGVNSGASSGVSNVPFPNSTGTAGGLFNNPSTISSNNTSRSDVKFEGDLWGTSRRSNPLD